MDRFAGFSGAWQHCTASKRMYRISLSDARARMLNYYPDRRAKSAVLHVCRMNALLGVAVLFSVVVVVLGTVYEYVSHMLALMCACVRFCDGRQHAQRTSHTLNDEVCGDSGGGWLETKPKKPIAHGPHQSATAAPPRARHMVNSTFVRQ